MFTPPERISDADVNEILALARARHEEGWPVLTFAVEAGTWQGTSRHPGAVDIAPVIAWVEQIGWTLDRLDWLSQPTHSPTSGGSMSGERQLHLLFRRAATA